MRSDVKENLTGRQLTRAAVVQIHLKGFRRYEASTAHDQFSAARAINLQVQRNLALHHLALAPTDRCHVNRDRIGYGAEVPAVTRNVRDLRTRNLVLAWHAGDVGTGAANPPPLHDDGLVPGLRQVPGQKLAASSAAKDQCVIR